MKKIKLIWDFRGPDAAKLAEHHAIHLKEFLDKEVYDITLVDSEVHNDFFAIASMVVYEKDMLHFRDILRPHRAVVYTID